MTLIVWLLVFTFGLLGQYFILSHSILAGLGIYLVTGSAFFVYSQYTGIHEDHMPASQPRKRDLSLILLGLGIVALVAALVLVWLGSQSGTNQNFLQIGLICWVSFIVMAFLASLYPLYYFSRLQSGGFYLSLILLILAAFGFGFYRLAELPITVHGDEGMVGLYARKIVEGDFQTFFSVSWYAIPQFFFMVPAATMLIFGDSLLGLRLSTVIVGTLTIIPFFILAYSWWGKRAALLSTILLITNHWFLHLMHSGVNYVQGDLFSTDSLPVVFHEQASAAVLRSAGGNSHGSGVAFLSGKPSPALLWVASQLYLLIWAKSTGSGVR